MAKRLSIKALFIYIAFTLIFLSAMAVLIYVGQNMNKEIPIAEINKIDCPIIIIDAGHGGEDGGATGITEVPEKDINLEISLNLYNMFKASGIPVVLTRDRDILLYDTSIDYHGKKKVLDLAKRLEISKQYENSIFISIHQNAFSDSKYSGLQVYYSGNNDLSLELAQAIQSLTKEKLQPQNNRKSKLASSNIFLLDRITTPAVLIECGFMSNDFECKLLSTEKYQKELSLVIYSAILNFLKNNNSFSSAY